MKTFRKCKIIRDAFSVKTQPFKLQVRTNSVASILAQKVQEGQLDRDAAQQKVANSLDSVLKNCCKYGGGSRAGPKGLYINGSIGGGKTMLMDLFYKVAPTRQKHRVHFDEFLFDVHKKIHQQKNKNVARFGVGRFGNSGAFDTITEVSNAIRKEHWLICLDDFQITDIANAMIIKRLFSDLFYKGLVMIATSDRKPSYKVGLQRTYLLPFIPILKKHCEFAKLDSNIDYRQKGGRGKEKFFYVNDDSALNKMFKVLIWKENDTVRPKTFTIMGKNVMFEKTCGRVLYTTFDELCRRDLSSIDYEHLSQFFHTVVIGDVPQLSTTKRTETKRFALLIDTLYDNQTRIVLSCNVPLEKLFITEEGDKTSDYTHEDVFAFDRTISRISEMCGRHYWDKNKPLYQH